MTLDPHLLLEGKRDQPIPLPPGFVTASAAACWIAFGLAVPHAWRGPSQDEDEEDPAVIARVDELQRNRRTAFRQALDALVTRVRAGELPAYGRHTSAPETDIHRPAIPLAAFVDTETTISDLDCIHQHGEYPRGIIYHDVHFATHDIRKVRGWPDDSSASTAEEVDFQEVVNRWIFENKPPKLTDALANIPTDDRRFTHLRVRAAYRRLLASQGRKTRGRRASTVE